MFAGQWKRVKCDTTGNSTDWDRQLRSLSFIVFNPIIFAHIADMISVISDFSFFFRKRDIKTLLAQLLKVMELESSPLADVFERYNAAKLTTVIDEDDEGMEIRRHFAFADGSHEDQKTSKKFNIESDFDVSEKNSKNL